MECEEDIFANYLYTEDILAYLVHIFMDWNFLWSTENRKFADLPIPQKPSITEWMSTKCKESHSWDGVLGVNLAYDHSSLSCNSINICCIHANSVRLTSNIDLPFITLNWRVVGEVKLIPEDHIIYSKWIHNPCPRIEHSQFGDNTVQHLQSTFHVSCIVP